MRNTWLAVGSWALLLLSGCGSGATSGTPAREADRAAVRTAVEAYLKGMQPPGDVAGMLSPFADSAHYLAAGKPTFKGREAIRSFFQGYVDAFTLGPVTYAIHDLRVSGDLAVAVVTATEEFTDKATGVVYRDDFKGISALTRHPDGAWRILYHTYNSDHPTPPTVAAK